MSHEVLLFRGKKQSFQVEQPLVPPSFAVDHTSPNRKLNQLIQEERFDEVELLQNRDVFLQATTTVRRYLDELPPAPPTTLRESIIYRLFPRDGFIFDNSSDLVQVKLRIQRKIIYASLHLADRVASDRQYYKMLLARAEEIGLLQGDDVIAA